MQPRPLDVRALKPPQVQAEPQKFTWRERQVAKINQDSKIKIPRSRRPHQLSAWTSSIHSLSSPVYGTTFKSSRPHGLVVELRLFKSSIRCFTDSPAVTLDNKQLRADYSKRKNARGGTSRIHARLLRLKQDFPNINSTSTSTSNNHSILSDLPKKPFRLNSPLPLNNVLPPSFRQRLLLPITRRPIQQRLPLRLPKRLLHPLVRILVLHAHQEQIRGCKGRIDTGMV